MGRAVPVVGTGGSIPRLDTFGRYASELTYRHAKVMGAGAIVVLLVFWPLDPILYGSEPEVLRAFAVWRGGGIAICAAGLGLLVLLARRRADLFVAATVFVAGCAALRGHMIALVSGLDDAVFYTGNFIPFATIPMIWAPVRRLGATLTTGGAYLAAYFATSPADLAHEHAGQAFTFQGFGVLMSLALGHTIYRLLQSNHAQRVELEERSARLEDLDRVKNDFFANISHELRTPLTLILAALRRLRDSSADAAPIADAGLRNSARLLVLINDLLELARFTGARGEARKQRVDVASLVAGVASSFRGSTPVEGELVVEGTDRAVAAEVDPRQLRTVLFNLLSNAFKFTRPEDRRIRMRLHADDSELRIEVRDNGEGIPDSQRTRVFERFYQLEGGRSRRRGGSGIGLALVHEIAVAHGGRVELDAADGGGSRFTVVLPRGDVGAGDEPAPRPSLDDVGELFAHAAGSAITRLPAVTPGEPAAPGRARDGSRARIVVAEDDPDLRAYVAEVLSARWDVVTAADGDEAVAQARRHRPDAVVCDVMMPDRTGFDVARELRSDPALERTPILFLTASTDTASRVEAYGAGADDFVTKPFEPEELRARVANLLALRRNERELAETNERLEARVAERTEQLRSLASHIETRREEERRQLAREIHDEMGQLLTALRMEVDLARRRSAGEGSLGDVLDRMDELCGQALDAARALVSELRPRVLDDLGLAAASEWYLERFAERSGLACVWDVQLDGTELEGARAAGVFRILQESLTNVARHAKARDVEIALRREENAVTLEVCDDGVGIGSAGPKREGFGLLGMRERARDLGGTLDIDAREPSGTRLYLRVPLAEGTTEAEGRA